MESQNKIKNKSACVCVSGTCLRVASLQRFIVKVVYRDTESQGPSLSRSFIVHIRNKHNTIDRRELHELNLRLNCMAVTLDFLSIALAS